MNDYLLLLAPAANRVYAQATPALAAAELTLTSDFNAIEPITLAGVEYLAFTSPPLSDANLSTISRQSAALALFERKSISDDKTARETLISSFPAQHFMHSCRSDVQQADTMIPCDMATSENEHFPNTPLFPIKLPLPFVMSDDLVTIPKYHGKTNEQFTRLLLNLTLATCVTGNQRPDVLDPLAGRGTTLSTAWLYGLDAAGVETDMRSFEALAAYFKTYLRTKRLKHSASVTPVRRDGKMLGHRFDAVLRGSPELKLSVFTGDTRDCAKLYGKRRFDCIVTDAPYGVSHGARGGTFHSNHDDENSNFHAKGAASNAGGRSSHVPPPVITRSPQQLLAEAVPVWSGQLKPGGALGIAFNTFTMPREALLEICVAAGLEPQTGDVWEQLAHRVDQAIWRDVVVARRPLLAAIDQS
ncbi:MAG: site-specific DNA-methyltransferase [Propionibacteriaceae bacterium]|jgi:tRNA G10  N-methylase Trm11|nr:site-specific DNA-methyltransferase [Propionibacteriaceae bacterium]